MKKTWIAIALIILIIVAVILTKTNPKEEESVKQDTTTVPSNDTVVEEETKPDTSVVNLNTTITTGATVPFTVEGGNFYFKPNTIKVKQGDTVTITFKNSDGFHDLKIDELGVATGQIKSGAETKVTFVASKKGSFEYYCSVGEHRAKGMKGTLIVE